jgi:hypothetical protein
MCYDLGMYCRGCERAIGCSRVSRREGWRDELEALPGAGFRGCFFLDFYTQLKQSRGYAQFQQDGAPSHQSKSTIAWLSSHDSIPLFFHPPSSPDLSPIGPVWLELKRILRSRRHTPTNIEQLKNAVRAAWDGIPIDFINRYIGHMPDRAKAVFAARGGHIRF